MVTGNGTDEPSSEELVSLPGAYAQHDPGLWVDIHPTLLANCARIIRKTALIPQTRSVRLCRLTASDGGQLGRP